MRQCITSIIGIVLGIFLLSHSNVHANESALYIEIEQRAFTPIERGANKEFSEITMHTSDSNTLISIHDLYIAIIARGNSQPPRLGALLRDVELRNVYTGKTVDTVRLRNQTDSGAFGNAVYQVYKVSDLTVREAEAYILRADVQEHGYTYDVEICSTASHEGCDFGILPNPSIVYTPRANELTHGNPIAVCNIADSDCIFGSFHGEVPVQLQSDTISVYLKEVTASDRIEKGSQHIPLLPFTIEAPCREDVVLHEVTTALEKGTFADFEHIYLEHNNVRISPRRMFNKHNGTTTLVLSEPFTIAACQKEDFRIIGTLSSHSASSIIQLSLDVYSDIHVGDTKHVSGAFPLRGTALSIEQQSTTSVRRTTPSITALTKEQRQQLRAWIREQMKIALNICLMFPTLEEQIACMQIERRDIRNNIKIKLQAFVSP